MAKFNLNAFKDITYPMLISDHDLICKLIQLIHSSSTFMAILLDEEVVIMCAGHVSNVQHLKVIAEASRKCKATAAATGFLAPSDEH
jgi:hypothetical protein